MYSASVEERATTVDFFETELKHPDSDPKILRYQSDFVDRRDRHMRHQLCTKAMEKMYFRLVCGEMEYPECKQDICML